MKTTYEEINGKTIMVETYEDGTFIKYDEMWNEIHFKSNYDEYWKDYDLHGNLIHYKNIDGYESWKEYDANDHIIHWWDNNGDDWSAEDYEERKVRA